MAKIPTTLVKKMSGKTFGPKRLLGEKPDVKKMILGRIFGLVNGITKSEMTDGSIAEGFRGQFVFVSNNEEMAPSSRSGVLWPPNGFMEEMFPLIKAPDAPLFIEFGYDVGVQRAENPAGYEWFMQPLIEAGAGDPLSTLAARMGEATLEAPAAQGQIENTKPAPLAGADKAKEGGPVKA